MIDLWYCEHEAHSIGTWANRRNCFVERRRKLIYWLITELLNDSDWWSIATVGALAFERQVWVLHADEFIWIWNLGRISCKCTPFYLFNRTVTSMMMITVVVNAMSKFKCRAIGAGSGAWRSLLLTITNAAVLDWKTRTEKFFFNLIKKSTHRGCGCHHVGQLALKTRKIVLLHQFSMRQWNVLFENNIYCTQFEGDKANNTVLINKQYKQQISLQFYELSLKEHHAVLWSHCFYQQVQRRKAALNFDGNSKIHSTGNGENSSELIFYVTLAHVWVPLETPELRRRWSTF